MGDLKSELESMLALQAFLPSKSTSKSTKIVVHHAPAPPVVAPSEVEEVKALVDAAKATATRRAYASDWRVFEAWCTTVNVCALPATHETMTRYLLYLFKRKHPKSKKKTATKTIERALSGIAFEHRVRGFDWEVTRLVREELRGIRKKRAEEGMHTVQKTPLAKNDLLLIMRKLGSDLRATRDRAILLILWLGAFRRAEVAGLDVSDVKFVPREGLLVRPKTSKTDQAGHDTGKALPLMTDIDACPTHALRAWLDAAAITQGPLFRRIFHDGTVGKGRLSDRSVAQILKNAVESIGLNPDEYGGHSARAGFMTSAAADGRDLNEIMDQSGHKSVAVARGYIRHGTKFTRNAAKGMF